MRYKIVVGCILLLSGWSSFAQIVMIFKYECSDVILDKTQVTVNLSCSDKRIELINDTIRKFETCFDFVPKANDYILSVEFKNLTIGKEVLNFPVKFHGNETDVEINLRFMKDGRKNLEYGSVEVIQYYESNHNLDIQYLPKTKGDKYYKAPFFMLKNNSNDTIYGKNLQGYFWGTSSVLIDFEDSSLEPFWTPEHFGVLDYNFAPRPPLYPDSTTVAMVGSFGWRNELPKLRHRYTALYSTDKSISDGIGLYSAKDNFLWRAGTKKYFRLIYEFDVK
jgi:hypothetical protein